MRRDELELMVESVPWARLAHAYGPATDAPDRLRGLASTADPSHADDLNEWLFGSIVHQGVTPYSATAPVLWIARRILRELDDSPALGPCLDAVGCCCWALTHARGYAPPPARFRHPSGTVPWATDLAPDTVVEREPDGALGDEYFVAAPADVATLSASLEDWLSTVEAVLDRRTTFVPEALRAAEGLLVLDGRSPIAAALDRVARAGDVPADLRAAALVALGRGGRDVSTSLVGDDRRLRFAAALGSPRSTGAVEVLTESLADVAWLEAAFPDGLATVEFRPRYEVVKSLIAMVPVQDAPAELVEALCGVVEKRATGALGATLEWGPVLEWAFPERVQEGVHQVVPLPTNLTDTQLRLLAALARNPDLWSPTDGNASYSLGHVGLPRERAAIASLAGVELTPPAAERWRFWRWRR